MGVGFIYNNKRVDDANKRIDGLRSESIVGSSNHDARMTRLEEKLDDKNN